MSSGDHESSGRGRDSSGTDDIARTPKSFKIQSQRRISKRRSPSVYLAPHRHLPSVPEEDGSGSDPTVRPTTSVTPTPTMSEIPHGSSTTSDASVASASSDVPGSSHPRSASESTVVRSPGRRASALPQNSKPPPGNSFTRRPATSIPVPRLRDPTPLRGHRLRKSGIGGSQNVSDIASHRVATNPLTASAHGLISTNEGREWLRNLRATRWRRKHAHRRVEAALKTPVHIANASGAPEASKTFIPNNGSHHAPRSASLPALLKSPALEAPPTDGPENLSAQAPQTSRPERLSAQAPTARPTSLSWNLPDPPERPSHNSYRPPTASSASIYNPYHSLAPTDRGPYPSNFGASLYTDEASDPEDDYDVPVRRHRSHRRSRISGEYPQPAFNYGGMWTPTPYGRPLDDDAWAKAPLGELSGDDDEPKWETTCRLILILFCWIVMAGLFFVLTFYSLFGTKFFGKPLPWCDEVDDMSLATSKSKGVKCVQRYPLQDPLWNGNDDGASRPPANSSFPSLERVESRKSIRTTM